MKKIVVAIDSFKGSLSTFQSGKAIEEAAICNERRIDAFFPIVRKPCTLDEAMNIDNAYNNLKDTACQVCRLIKVYNNK